MLRILGFLINLIVISMLTPKAFAVTIHCGYPTASQQQKVVSEGMYRLSAEVACNITGQAGVIPGFMEVLTNFPSSGIKTWSESFWGIRGFIEEKGKEVNRHEMDGYKFKSKIEYLGLGPLVGFMLFDAKHFLLSNGSNSFIYELQSTKILDAHKGMKNRYSHYEIVTIKEEKPSHYELTAKIEIKVKKPFLAPSSFFVDLFKSLDAEVSLLAKLLASKFKKAEHTWTSMLKTKSSKE